MTNINELLGNMAPNERACGSSGMQRGIFETSKLRPTETVFINDPHVETALNVAHIKYMLTGSPIYFSRTLKRIRMRMFSALSGGSSSHRNATGLFKLMTGCDKSISEYVEGRFLIDSPTKIIVTGIEEMIGNMPIRRGLMAVYHNFQEPLIGYDESARNLYRRLTVETLFSIHVKKMREIVAHYHEIFEETAKNIKESMASQIESDSLSLLRISGDGSIIGDIHNYYING